MSFNLSRVTQRQFTVTCSPGRILNLRASFFSLSKHLRSVNRVMDKRDEVASRVASSTNTRPHVVTPMGLKTDNLADVLARQEREPSNSFTNTLQPIRSRTRLSFGFGGSRAEIVPASNRVSLKVVEQERQIRLMLSSHVKYKYMLLPDSMARYWWDLLMACVTILLMWRIPYSISFTEGGKEYWNVFYRVTDVIYILDIIANFRCAGCLGS